MRYLNTILLSAGLTLCAAAYAATIYKWKDASGNIHFSDEPHKGAEVIQQPDIINSYSAPPPPVKGEGLPGEILKLDETHPGEAARPSPVKKGPDTAVTKYTKVEVVSPGNDETVRDNTGTVAVSVLIMPGLDSEHGHKVRLYVDGKAYGGDAASTSFSLSGMERGEHTLKAAVLDKQGKELLGSEGTIFFLRQQSSQQPGGGGSL